MDVSNLAACLGGVAVAGGSMKEAGTLYWQSPNTGTTNFSGFTALPAGNRGGNGFFGYAGTESYIWTATPYDANNALQMHLTSIGTDLNINFFLLKRSGASVRCVRD
jgi:uncharacterized protein (TIGR02145 family)